MAAPLVKTAVSDCILLIAADISKRKDVYTACFSSVLTHAFPLSCDLVVVNADSCALVQTARPRTADLTSSFSRSRAVPVCSSTVGVVLADSLTFFQCSRDNDDRAGYTGVRVPCPLMLATWPPTYRETYPGGKSTTMLGEVELVGPKVEYQMLKTFSCLSDSHCEARLPYLWLIFCQLLVYSYRPKYCCIYRYQNFVTTVGGRGGPRIWEKGLLVGLGDGGPSVRSRGKAPVVSMWTKPFRSWLSSARKKAKH